MGSNTTRSSGEGFKHSNWGMRQRVRMNGRKNHISKRIHGWIDKRAWFNVLDKGPQKAG